MPRTVEVDDVTQNIETELEKLQQLGAIQYYLPSDPRGRRFVVGIDGRILNMDPEQAMCFISGAHAVALVWIREKKG